MSDKPLAEQMRGNEKYVGGACADMVEQFVREHLTEQTEPSEEIKQKLREVAIDLGHKKADYAIAKLLETTAQWTINAERRRIRELLVGKERP